jgi:hypothetical protein
MTKDEMSTLLRSVGCDENTITAMENAYEMGFEQGAQAGNLLREVVVEAVALCHEADAGVVPVTAAFWHLHDKLRDMQ